MGRKKQNRVYAAYRGEEFLDIGTVEYLQEKYGYTKSTLEFSKNPIAKKRNPNALNLLYLGEKEFYEK